MTARPSRRAVLSAGLALPLLAACTGEEPDPGPPPPPDPDLALHAAAVAREQRLLEAYDAALLSAPSLAARLTAVRAEHAEHLAALAEADPAPPSPSPSRSAAASPSAGPTAPPPPPADPATVLAGLVALESETATGHGAGAVEASRELGVVLATLAASEASHGVALA